MSRALAALRDHPSATLLGAQLLSLIAYPFLNDSTVGRSFVGVVGMLILLLALWAVRRTPALNWVAGLLAAPAMVLTVIEAMWPNNDAVILTSAALHAPFYFYVSWAMIRYVFADTRVTRDELFATGAAFTVVAWGFAYVYAAVQVIWPGSFVGAGGVDQHHWFDLLFLSFTTLTSVGLSDILPMSAHARSAVMLEEVAGVMYIALVVARLVGMTSARS